MDGALERNIRRNILTELDIHRRSIVGLTFDAFQIEDDLNEGENNHRNTDSPWIQPRLHAPFVRFENDDAEKNKCAKAKNTRRSDFQMSSSRFDSHAPRDRSHGN